VGGGGGGGGGGGAGTLDALVFFCLGREGLGTVNTLECDGDLCRETIYPIGQKSPSQLVQERDAQDLSRSP